jgi:hypothetical protein
MLNMDSAHNMTEIWIDFWTRDTTDGDDLGKKATNEMQKNPLQIKNERRDVFPNHSP